MEKQKSTSNERPETILPKPMVYSSAIEQAIFIEATNHISKLANDGKLGEVFSRIKERIPIASVFWFRSDGNEIPDKQTIEFFNNISSKNHTQWTPAETEAVYSMILLEKSGTRLEEVNGMDLNLSSIHELFKKKLESYGIRIQNDKSLMDTAEEVKEARAEFLKYGVLYQDIDGNSKRRVEKHLNRTEKPAEITSLEAEVDGRLSRAVNSDEYTDLIEFVSKNLGGDINADYVILSGPVRNLTKGQETTVDDFFSYPVLMEGAGAEGKTAFVSDYDLRVHISDGLRGGRKRYFDSGYMSLMPGIAHDINRREEHEAIGVNQVVRCPAALYGVENSLDLRCSRASDIEFTESDLDRAMHYASLYKKIVESAFRKGIELPNINR